jgi:exopolyphosphatase/guanosine-5'-triphosphate,3'-diphosphate pyrophosphatase
MAATPAPSPVKPKIKLGLRSWMERVLEECDRAAVGFEPDPVHDLRVALRRCRSLADGMMAIDPDSSWKAMKKAGKKVFQSLGELRDMHVMHDWIEKLSDPGDPVAAKLLAHVRACEIEAQQTAMHQFSQFDRKQWRQWSRSLPRRAARVRLGSLVFEHLALEKWTNAYELHKRAMRSRSQISLHALRIGIKRFRYTVENFLPQQHAAWGDELKELQDLLGEVHDFDVLWATAVQIAAFPDPGSRVRWREKLNKERNQRIERYREKMVGKQSLWRVWRTELPGGEQLRAAAIARLGTWASYLDPDFAHSRRVAQLSLALHDGLRRAGLMNGIAEQESRSVLQAAALLHDVGKAKGNKSHHKASFRLIRKLSQPLGWSARELELAAIVARYHRGALPHPRTKNLQALQIEDRHMAVELAGILRLANAMDTRKGTQTRVQVSLDDRTVLVQAAGYSALDRSAEEVAGARHLLETVLRRPVMVRPLRASRERRVANATLSRTTARA